MTIVSFQHACRSDKGMRERQEDAYGIRVFHSLASRNGEEGEKIDEGPTELVAVLADGMGGHVGGARASKLTCSRFLATYPKIEGSIEWRLLRALEDCNKGLAKAIKRNQKLHGMGSTLVGLSIDATGLHWISVGDSLLYLYRDKKLKRLNEDHSLAPVLDELVAQGEMGAQESLHHPKRNMLRSAVTGDEVELVDLSQKVLPLESGDWLIVASDGITTLTEDKIGKIISRTGSQGADQIVRALISAVKKQAEPQQDNTTVLAIGFDKK
jgi:protein phosphatase